MAASTPYSTHSHARRRAPASKLTCSVLLGMALGLFIFAAVTALGGFVLLHQADFILPGVSVRGTSLSGLTVAEAEQTLRTSWDSAPPSLRLLAGNREWSLPAPQLGLGIEAAATARRAQSVGRGLDIANLIPSLFNGLEIKPIVTLDPVLAGQTLTQWAATVNLPPQDAAFHIEGGQVVTTPAQPGQALDVESTLAVLVADPSLVVKNGYMSLVMKPVAPAITDVSAQVAQVSQLLATPLTINGYDAITDEWLNWTPAPEVIVSWLGVQPGSAAPEITLVPEKVAAYLTELNPTLGEGRHVEVTEAVPLITEGLSSGQSPTVLIRHSPTTYVVQSGDNLTQIGWKVGIPYWRIVQANPGLDANGLNAGQVLTIPSKDDLLPLPVVPNKRIVVSLDQQRMWTFENRQQIKDYVISTGIDRSPTQPGIFQVQTHEPNAYASIWNLWMPNFLGIYEAWPGFMNGFHGLPMLASGRRLWADVLGRPASYGCIILTLDAAEELYHWADAGVVVEIKH